MPKLKIAIMIMICTLLFTGINAASVSASLAPTSSSEFAKEIIRRGARGGYVWEMQNRLKFLGFYTGPVNGTFDARTERAVRLFQYEFRLKVDGLVGPKTKLKLYLATKNWAQAKKAPTKKGNKPPLIKSSHGLTKNDIDLLARTVHAEARGESYVGQVAVAAVILNRLDSELFPNTISGIVFQPLAFEAVADGQIWLSSNETAKKAVMDALNGWDPSGGALYYFNPDRATSKWIWSRPQLKRIGKHIFCK
ncbi:spore cortex-lytic enzyme [Thermoflavimicrobium daqui]|jgi:spore cortex-lytic enzyme|uniref:Spore cortex-lytic enzyme n=1 Tax=Thermoflavimicrobium daqui TaxID=2137476 RepID=A0A364K914_9BACL|nr:spore cortex-lytic enzyme [Thermoflavimicrobium daqui]RAL26789.1 spore cortex-lytic enzyme [Thermoflavimicrobium daqui]